MNWVLFGISMAVTLVAWMLAWLVRPKETESMEYRELGREARRRYLLLSVSTIAIGVACLFLFPS